MNCTCSNLQYPADSSWVHLPNLERIDGIMNLLSLCVLVILANVLDFRSYSPAGHRNGRPLTRTEKWMITEFDINAIPTNERLAMCYTRGAALHLFKWIRECCVIHGPGDCIVDDLPSRFLAQIGKAMILYKSRVQRQKLEGVIHCSLDSLTSQINNIMEFNDEFRKVWANQVVNSSCSLELEDQAQYRVEWKAISETLDGWTSTGQG